MQEHRPERHAHSARKLRGAAEKPVGATHSVPRHIQTGERADGGGLQGAQRAVDGEHGDDDVLWGLRRNSGQYHDRDRRLFMNSQSNWARQGVGGVGHYGKSSYILRKEETFESRSSVSARAVSQIN